MNNIKIARQTLEVLTDVFKENRKQWDLSEVKEKLQGIIDHLSEDGEVLTFFDGVTENNRFNVTKDSDNYRALEVLKTCCYATDSDFNDFEMYEMLEVIEEIKDKRSTDDDFYIDSLPCGEVRIIEGSAIDEIWTESLIEQIKDCYDLSNVPDFVAIDWEQTAENCKVDGKGHHFASYDHEEHYIDGLYIFRTN